MLTLSWKKLSIEICLIAVLVAAVVLVLENDFFWSRDVTPLHSATLKDVQTEVSPVDQKVLAQTQSSILVMLEGFGTPGEDDIRVFQEDPRFLAFSSSLMGKLGGTLPEGTMKALMDSARLAWFRQDMLTKKYESGEINMDTFTLGLSMIMKIDSDFVKTELTDEQYFTRIGEPKSDTDFELEESNPTSGNYSEIASLFPAIRNGEHPEIQSAEDLYKVIPKEAIEKIAAGDRERLRVNRESTRAFRLGKISQEEYDKQLDVATQAMRDAIKSAVKPKQEVFLFGYEF